MVFSGSIGRGVSRGLTNMSSRIDNQPMDLRMHAKPGQFLLRRRAARPRPGVVASKETRGEPGAAVAALVHLPERGRVPRLSPVR